MNPLWEREEELQAEFDRFGIDGESHLLVGCEADGEILGFAGFLRRPGADAAGLVCPVVRRGGRRRGIGGEILRAALASARDRLGITLVTAGIGTRNRAGYSLLASHGFKPLRHHFMMRCDQKPVAPEAPLADLRLDVATNADVKAIHDIYRVCDFEPRDAGEMQAVLEDGRHFHAIAKLRGQVIAFVEIETHWTRRNWVSYVGVDEDFRDRGVGSSLVAWALARRFEAGAEAGLLLLSPANRTAVRAYEKVGFRRARLIDVLVKNL